VRIGIDISQVVYQGTGIATYTQKLVENLLKIDKKNEYLLFGSSLRRRKKLKDFVSSLPGVGGRVKEKISPFPPLILEKLWNKLHVWPIEKLIGEIDVFHSSDWLQPPSKAKKVTTIHDLIVYKCPQSFSRRGGHNIVANQKRRLSWVKNESDLVIADSQATKNDIMEILGIPASKIRVIYLAADEKFKPQSEQEIAKVKKKYKVSGKYVLAFGGSARKNVDRIKEACPSDFQVFVVGQPFVSADDLPALYAGAGCLVYPSFYEGFGLPILEAMACGCPVVTSTRGSLVEVAGGAAVLVDPEKTEEIAAGIKKAIKNKKELKQKGFKQAGKFSWRKTAKQTLKVYQEATKC